MVFFWYCDPPFSGHVSCIFEPRFLQWFFFVETWTPSYLTCRGWDRRFKGTRRDATLALAAYLEVKQSPVGPVRLLPPSCNAERRYPLSGNVLLNWRGATTLLLLRRFFCTLHSSWWKARMSKRPSAFGPSCSGVAITMDFVLPWFGICFCEYSFSTYSG